MKPESPLNNFNVQPQPVEAPAKFEFNRGSELVKKGSKEFVQSNANRPEMGSNTGDVAITTVLPTPVVDDTTVVQDTTTTSYPAAASDDDLIEKEWVDKAKKIVSETRDDPHQREQEVSKLQVDYLKKRYGRELGADK